MESPVFVRWATPLCSQVGCWLVLGCQPGINATWLLSKILKCAQAESYCSDTNVLGMPIKGVSLPFSGCSRSSKSTPAVLQVCIVILAMWTIYSPHATKVRGQPKHKHGWGAARISWDWQPGDFFFTSLISKTLKSFRHIIIIILGLTSTSRCGCLVGSIRLDMTLQSFVILSHQGLGLHTGGRPSQTICW